MKKIIIFALVMIIMGTCASYAQWTKTNCPSSGYSISCFAVNGNNIFAGSGGGVYLSTNNGTSWTVVNNGLPSNAAIRSLTVSGNNIFAAIITSSATSGIYLSTNNGASWVAVNNGLPSGVITTSLTANGNNIFAGTEGNYGGLFLSTNNGTSWTAAHNGLPPNTIMNLATSGNNIFAGMAGGVYLSTNNGTSWTAVNNGLSVIDNFHVVVGNNVFGNNVFASTYDTVFYSSDNGTNWTPATDSGFPSLCIGLAINGNNIFASSYDGVYLSSDNANSWTAENAGLMLDTSITAIAIGTNDVFVGTSTGMVYKRPLSDFAGIDEINGKVNFSAYPNPFNDQINIKVDGKNIIAVLNDITGRKVNQYFFDNNLTIETSSLPKGVYVLNVISGNKVSTIKLVK